ncbi:hypothetical protein GCM10028824_07130 [Hymenobacter segetis]|uniref:Uncharacterized protein n=1 Tax=Hymenobacter segetis TaxID=2025509 RepID=A0ABU9M1M0_9BACT
MPKLIDYPRTSYTGAWELAEITDDTGGKCTIETAARKLNRKVSGSFKAIIGSAVKFGLITSKRELLTTTTLFKRIKHAYDKQEELAFHREAFLTPPLFTQICRKFRSRELPVQMLDVMLIREFGVEEINSQGVAKAFVDGCRMVGLLDEHNTIADIDSLSAKQTPRQQLASPVPRASTFRPENELSATSLFIDPTETVERAQSSVSSSTQDDILSEYQPIRPLEQLQKSATQPIAPVSEVLKRDTDAIASLFGFTTDPALTTDQPRKEAQPLATPPTISSTPSDTNGKIEVENQTTPIGIPTNSFITRIAYQIQISGPGVNTELSITEEEDIILAMALLEKIRRQIKA